MFVLGHRLIIDRLLFWLLSCEKASFMFVYKLISTGMTEILNLNVF